MTAKQIWKDQYGAQRALVHGSRERAREASQLLKDKARESWRRGMDMLEEIKGELKEKLDILWERNDDEPTFEAAMALPKLPLGADNANFPPGYFDSFSGKTNCQFDDDEDN